MLKIIQTENIMISKTYSKIKKSVIASLTLKTNFKQMKTIITYTIILSLSLFLNSGTSRAQSGNEIKFNFTDHPLTTDKNMVSVSAFVNAKQPSGDGIHFTIIVKNNSGKSIFIKNIANQLSIALYNERGLDISVPDLDKYADVNRATRKWKFRTESVFPSKLHTNGKEEKSDLKMLEYFEFPAGGNSKINLIIKNVKQVNTPEDVRDKFSKPTINLAPGKYKLKMWLPIFSNDQNKSGGFVASFQSTMIDVDYGIK